MPCLSRYGVRIFSLYKISTITMQALQKEPWSCGKSSRLRIKMAWVRFQPFLLVLGGGENRQPVDLKLHPSTKNMRAAVAETRVSRNDSHELSGRRLLTAKCSIEIGKKASGQRVVRSKVAARFTFSPADSLNIS